MTQNQQLSKVIGHETYTAQVVKIGAQFCASIVRNEIQSYGYGSVPAKMVSVSFFSDEKTAADWLSNELKNLS